MSTTLSSPPDSGGHSLQRLNPLQQGRAETIVSNTEYDMRREKSDEWHRNTVPDLLDADSSSGHNPHIDSPDVLSVVTCFPS